MNRPWWHTAVVYQIYPRSFQDSTGNGVGDLPGITSRLGHVAGLGVDAIWISPFYPSPMADFGYDVSDYTDVEPLFGTLDDFDHLLSTAHDLGLRVIIDWVPNHTSDRHPWFLASRSSRQDPKRDWYVWRDPASDGGPPNNWVGQFGGPAWEFDEVTGQYYLSSFLPEQADLNWRNPEVEAAMFDTVRFWMDRGVDGMRIDVAHFIMKDPEYRSHPEPGTGGERIHDKGHPDVHAVFRRLRALLDGYGDRLAVGEIHIFDWEEWVAYYGDDDELHMPFNFTTLRTPWEAGAMRDAVDGLEAALPAWAWPNHVLGNHDEPRLLTRYGGLARAKAAAVMLLTLRGTPTLYYGDEIGMPQIDIPPERQQDPFGYRVPGQGRDGCRIPMQWGDERGFTSGEPWLPMTDHPTVADQEGDPESILELYRRLLSLRRAEPDLQVGGYEPIDAGDGVFAYRRGTSFAVAINFTPSPVTVAVAGRVEVASDRSLEGTDVDELVLGGDQAAVVRIR